MKSGGVQQPKPIVAKEEKYTHIKLLAGNDRGDIHVLPDLHDCPELLEMALADVKFENGDQVYGLGDLHDKGPEPVKVIDKVLDMRKKFGNTAMPVIYGNHERVLKEYADALAAYERAGIQSDDAELAEKEDVCEDTGQQWALDLAYDKREKFDEIIRLISSFPYIQVVESKGQTPGFITVHADLPFTQTELRTRIKKDKLMLGDDGRYSETMHAVWARWTNEEKYGGIQFNMAACNLEDVISYCGHNPLQGLRLRGYHFNGDLGPHRTHCLIRFNHTKRTATLYHTKAAHPAVVQQAQAIVDNFNFFYKFVERLQALPGMIRQLQEFKFPADQSPDAKLFADKLAVLIKLKETAENYINKENPVEGNTNPRALAALVNAVLVQNIKVLAAPFQTSHFQEWNKFFAEMINKFKVVRTELPDNTILHHTHSLELGWIEQKTDVTPVNFADLPKMQAFGILRKFLQEAKPENWREYTVLKSCVHTRGELQEFIEYCADGPLKPADLLNHFFDGQFNLTLENGVRFFQDRKHIFCFLDDQGKIIDFDKLEFAGKTNFINQIFAQVQLENWEKVRLWCHVIQNENDMFNFLNHCRFEDFFKFCDLFLPLTPFKIFDEPKSVAKFLIMVNKVTCQDLLGYLHKRREKLTKKENVEFYYEILAALVVQPSINAEQDSLFKGKLQRCIQHLKGSKTSLLDFLEDIYRTLILISTASYPDAEKIERMKIFLADKYCQVCLLDEKSKLVTALAEILKLDFGVEMPNRILYPIDTLQLLAKTDQENVCGQIQGLLPSGNKEAKQGQAPEFKFVSIDNTIHQAFCAMQTLQSCAQQSQQGMFKPRDSKAQEKLDTVQHGLSVLHVHVPPSTKFTAATPCMMVHVGKKPEMRKRPKPEPQVQPQPLSRPPLVPRHEDAPTLRRRTSR